MESGDDTDTDESRRGTTVTEHQKNGHADASDGATVSYTVSPEERPSVAVVSAVAMVLEVDPMSLRPLYEVVDPEALNDVVAPDEDGERTVSTAVRFRYHGCDVAVYGDGRVTVSQSESDG